MILGGSLETVSLAAFKIRVATLLIDNIVLNASKKCSLTNLGTFNLRM